MISSLLSFLTNQNYDDYQKYDEADGEKRKSRYEIVDSAVGDILACDYAANITRPSSVFHFFMNIGEFVLDGLDEKG